MKYNRRGFIALSAVLSTSHSFGRSGMFTTSSNHKSPIQKFKKLFELKSHFLPRELSKIFNRQFKSFKALGYKNQFKGCLMNGDKTFAIAPLAISGTNNNDQHVFLIFTKDVAWSFVGTFNQYESELFLAISEKLQATQKGFSPQSILPKAKIIDGLENPFVSDENSYWFNVKLTNRNLEGSVVFKNRDAEEESVKIYFGA